MMRTSKQANRLQLIAAAATLILGVTLQPAAAQRFGTDGNTRHGSTVASRDLARTYDPFVSVWMERLSRFERKDYAPRGIPVGQFHIFPSLQILSAYDDNIFASRSNEEGDLRYDIAPVVRIRSDFERHILDIAFGGTYTGFAKNSFLNHLDPFANVRWRLDLDHATAISGTATSQIEHDDFISPERPESAAEPIKIFSNRGSINFKREVARLNFGAGATYVEEDFYDVLGTDGALLDQDNRDHRTYAVYGRLGYEFSPGFSLITRIRGYKVDNYGATDLDRSAAGYEVQAGVDFELTPLLRFNVMAGYDRRNFETADFRNTGAITYDGTLKWLLTPLITIDGSFGRGSQFTTSGRASQRIDTRGSLGIEYRMWRNLILTAGAEATISDFEGTDREDTTYIGRAGIQYLLNRNLKFTLDYEHRTYDSTNDEFSYDRNRVRLGVTLQH